MADWKHYINSKFSSCRHIANARDTARSRDVRIYHIPGVFDYVGISDGTDCWIGPVTIDPFSAGVARLLEDVRAGKPIAVEALAQQRAKPRRVAAAPPPPQMELPLAKPRVRAVAAVKERVRAV